MDKCVFFYKIRSFSQLIVSLVFYLDAVKRLNSPVICLEWPRGFHEVKVPRFHDNGTEWW